MRRFRNYIFKTLLENELLKEHFLDEELDIKADTSRQWIILTSDTNGELFNGFAKNGPLQTLAKQYSLKFFFNAPTKQWFLSYKPETLEKTKSFTGITTKEELKDKVLEFIQAANKQLDANYEEKSSEDLKEKYKNLFDIVEKIEDKINTVSSTNVGGDEEERKVTDIIKRKSKQAVVDYYKYLEELANSMEDEKLAEEIMKIESMKKKMHGFSLYNSFLIFIQSQGTASKCMNKKDWKKYFNREVVNESNGFFVQYPSFEDSKTNPLAIRKMIAHAESKGDFKKAKEIKEKAAKGQPVLRGFSWGITYDISNTKVIEGKEDLVYDYKWHEEDTPNVLADKLFSYAIEFAQKEGIKVDVEEAMQARGLSGGGKIKLQSTLQGVGALSTIVHEMAHELMHWDGSKFFSKDGGTRTTEGYDVGELQAEAVAFAVLRSYDFELSGAHQLYIKLYRGNKDKIKKYTPLLSNVAHFIESGINKIAMENHGEGKKQ